MRATTRTGRLAPSRRLRGAGRVVIVAMVVALVLSLLALPSQGGTTLGVDVTARGSGSIHTPGIACDEGGDGAYWHHDYRGPVPEGTLNGRPAELRTHLDLHSDLVRFPGIDPAATDQPAPEGPAAWLAGTDSRTTFVDDRGTLQLALESGDCDAPTLDFDGDQASGSGTWSVHHGTGGYEGATGTGSFNLTAEVGPTADEALAIHLAGPVDVLRPSVVVEVVETYWGALGSDYLTRRPTVVFRVANDGPGYAYGAEVTDAFTTTNGVHVRGPKQHHLGDLEPGQEAFVAVRYQLGLLTPCALVLLGCDFVAGLDVSMPDVLDDPVTAHIGVPTSAPDLPPPL